MKSQNCLEYENFSIIAANMQNKLTHNNGEGFFGKRRAKLMEMLWLQLSASSGFTSFRLLCFRKTSIISFILQDVNCNISQAHIVESLLTLRKQHSCHNTKIESKKDFAKISSLVCVSGQRAETANKFTNVREIRRHNGITEIIENLLTTYCRLRSSVCDIDITESQKILLLDGWSRARETFIIFLKWKNRTNPSVVEGRKLMAKGSGGIVNALKYCFFILAATHRKAS